MATTEGMQRSLTVQLKGDLSTEHRRVDTLEAREVANELRQSGVESVGDLEEVRRGERALNAPVVIERVRTPHRSWWRALLEEWRGASSVTRVMVVVISVAAIGMMALVILLLLLSRR